MNWYYLNDAGEVAGPVSDSTLEKLRAMNRLADNAQVCREGSEDWISLAEALGTFTATPAGGSESVVPSAARTVVNTLPQSHQTPGSQLNVQHAARQVRFKGGGTTRQATPPRSTGKKRTLILSAIGVLAAVIVGVVFVTSKQDWKANFSDAEWTEKTFSEALENIDEKQVEGIRSTGASALQRARFGVIPQLTPVLLSQVLYALESNSRSATVVGAIVGGGIGLLLTQAISTQKDWEEVAYYMVLIVGMVMLMDSLSGWVRRRLIRG